MKVINYTDARRNLRKVLDEVSETDEHCVITSKNNHVVVLSSSEYDKLMKAVIDNRS